MRSALRAATRDDHALLDSMILRLQLSRKQDYALFLHIHYSVLQDLQADWRSNDHEDFTEMLGCLQADLQSLGRATAKLHATSRTLGRHGDRLGVAYVIRGSRLGAKLLRGLVPNQFPTAYLDFVPRLTWALFLQQLEQTPQSENGAVDDAIHGAAITFERFVKHFTQAMRDHACGSL
jgi:heme oxygenase